MDVFLKAFFDTVILFLISLWVYSTYTIFGYFGVAIHVVFIILFIVLFLIIMRLTDD